MPYPLLVCTYTNVAVDNLVEGMAAVGIRPLRVGFNAKVKPALHPHTLDAKIELHPLKPEIDKLQASIHRLQDSMQNVKEKMKQAEPFSAKEATCQQMLNRMGSDLKAKKGRIWARNREMVQDIVSKADVVSVVTLIEWDLNVDRFAQPVSRRRRRRSAQLTFR